MAFWRPDVDPDTEPLRILISRGSWVDAKRRDREVPYKIYHPSDAGDTAFPLIVWSHGLGGNRDGAGFISRFLASHGYIIAHVQHKGTDSALWEGKPGHPWDVIRATRIPRRAVLDRYLDIPFALDCLIAGTGIESSIAARMDVSAPGMSGHSFGAGTTQIMAGQKLGRGRRQYSLREPRFSCGILYSPVPSFNRIDSPRSIYGDIGIPLLHMTGTDDTSPIEGFGHTRRMEVFENSGGPEQTLMILKDGDHMIYNGSRGQLGRNDKREQHETAIRMAALAFWDAHLKKDRAAWSWLNQGGLASHMANEGQISFKP